MACLLLLPRRWIALRAASDVTTGSLTAAARWLWMLRPWWHGCRQRYEDGFDRATQWERPAGEALRSVIAAVEGSA